MKKPKLILALCLSTCMGFAQNFTQVINVAGNGTYGTTTNGNAINTHLGAPEGIAIDVSGNMYIADKANGVILKVNTAGVISKIAGTSGSSGYSGDGGSASTALFNAPTYLCLDPSNNLYISDAGNFVVRKITAQNGVINANCTITTVAGDGTNCYSGGPFGNPVCGNAVLATAASIQPTGIAVDNNYNLYIASKATIKEVFNATTVINNTTYQAGYIYIVAGQENQIGSSGNNGQAINARFNTVHGIALDAISANLYICDSDNSQVRKINLATGIITLFAGISSSGGFGGDGGQATLAKLSSNQFGIAVDAKNNVYIADQGNFRIRMVNPSGVISTVAGTGSTLGYCNYLAPTGNNNGSTGASINPYQIAVDACGSIYFCDYGAYVVGKIPNGTVPSYNSLSISSPSPICTGTNITAACTTGSTVPPDSYSWTLLSCDATGHGDGIYNSGTFTIDNTSTNSNSSSYTFPYTTGMPCGHNYIIQMTVRKNCPTLTINTVYKQIYINCADVPVITGNTNICLGNNTSTILTSNYANSSNNTIHWSTGGTSLGSNQSITVSPTATTTYDLTATYNPTGCGGTTSVVVNVAANNPDFSYVENYTSPNNYFTVSATPIVTNANTVPGFGDLWVVEQIDPITLATIQNTNTSTGTLPNPTCWWSYYPGANVFGGFDGTKSSGVNNVVCGPPVNPVIGKFLNGATYRITRGTWNSYCSWSQISHIITFTGHKASQGNIETNLDESTIDYSYLRNSSNILLPNDTKIEESLATIYPNPSMGSFTIETSETTPQLLQVFDLTGRMVINQTINGTTTINATDLVDGVYNIKITNSQGTVNKKVIITK